MMKTRQTVSKAKLPVAILLTVLTVLTASSFNTAQGASKPSAGNKKLKIVFLLGQSNMVGYAHPRTAWYLTQPIYTPPAKTATVKSRLYTPSQFYWQGVNFARGDSEEYNARGKALLAERKAIIKLWRGRVYANFSRAAKASGKKNEWNTKEWGPAPVDAKGHFRSYMGKYLTGKIAAQGVFKRIEEHIESPENKLHPKVAIGLIANRNKPIADDIKRVREIFLKDAKPEDFDGLDQAIKAMGRIDHKNRMAYAELVRKHINIPIAKRTRISALGAVSGEPTDNKPDGITHGVLSLGYTKFATNCGPEYPFGISFERMVDGPVLLIKCAWGGKSLHSEFRPPSLNTKENPTGKFWTLATEHIGKVLADPGKYHPDYDPKVGYELSGLVWFQGWNDKGNKDYGQQLVAFIKDFRKEVKAPKLPVVCGLLGHSSWKTTTFDGDVNSGMLHATRHADLKGTVDIVNTVKYYPIELGFKGLVKDACGEDSPEYKTAESIINRAVSKDPVHYHGSAKFYYLTGDAMARKLANLIKGGAPTIHKEAEDILKTEK
ncbi:MAG: hypothetical protein HN350_08540 [Phycisphaerales bacterium]|jgi:hypothetical protein|nr:hypothetical protein [Phycisphaerales bacterium]